MTEHERTVVNQDRELAGINTTNDLVYTPLPAGWNFQQDQELNEATGGELLDAIDWGVPLRNEDAPSTPVSIWSFLPTVSVFHLLIT